MIEEQNNPSLASCSPPGDEFQPLSEFDKPDEYLALCLICGLKWFIDRDGKHGARCPGCETTLINTRPMCRIEHNHVKKMEKEMKMEMKKKEGLKFDDDKPRLDLVPPIVMLALGAVLKFGAKKYGPNSWQNVENGRDRYYAALLRHLMSWREGECCDEESELPHLWHALCYLAFMVWIDRYSLEKD